MWQQADPTFFSTENKTHEAVGLRKEKLIVIKACFCPCRRRVRVSCLFLLIRRVRALVFCYVICTGGKSATHGQNHNKERNY
jgi:hypothetical protein